MQRLHQAIAVCFIFLSQNLYADTTFIRFGSPWQYLDNGSDADTSWRNISQSGTSSWPVGVSEFGYGNGTERTRINYDENDGTKNITRYFRTSFDITNKQQFSVFRLRAYFDDGIVAYINGKEVCRANMGAGVIKYNTLASSEIIDDGNIISSFDIPMESFVNGINYIAVEVHQFRLINEDLTFDLELLASSIETPTEIIRGPLLQMVSGDGITITWKTNNLASSSVQYGVMENSLTSFVSNGVLSKDHEMRIVGLQPDTKYYYAIGNGPDLLEGSYRNYFITSPAANTTRKIRIGLFGDAGTGDQSQKRARNSYLRLFKQGTSAELAIMLGDNAYNTGTDQEYQANFFDIYDDNIFDNHVVFPIPGNHEYYSPGVPYFNIFSLPAAAESGGLASGTEAYYSFNYGNIHFLMLNSMDTDGAGKALYDSTGDQAIWLKKDLAANAGSHKWTIACVHHPPYTNGSHNSDAELDLIAIRQQVTPILERFGVDAVLSGHSHVYERSFLIQDHKGMANTFVKNNLVDSSSARYDGSVNSCPYFTIDTVAKKGTVYVVAGSAGQIGGGTNADMPLFYYKNYSGTTGGESGVLYLEVEDNRLDAKFIGISGTVRDQFTIMKGVNTRKIISTPVNKTIEITASWVGNYNWLPTPSPGKDGFKTLAVHPDQTGNFVYYVSDSIGTSHACITDTFEIQASSVLPASPLIKFEALQKNNTNLLKWSVEKGENIDYFTLERSSNDRAYNLLTIVRVDESQRYAQSSFSAYEFVDNYPTDGINYYRLSGSDKSGQAFILGTKMINFKNSRPFKYQIRSNSASQKQIDITCTKKQLLQITLCDLNGRIVYDRSLSAVPGVNTVRVVSPPGIYILNIIAANNERLSEKIIIE